MAAKIAGIAYNRVAVVALGYRAADIPMSLEGFGYLSPQRERRDVLGVQWCSSIFPNRAPTGTVLLRALCGGWNRPEIVDWDDNRLLTAVRAELAAAMGVRRHRCFTRSSAGNGRSRSITSAIWSAWRGSRSGRRGVRGCSSAATLTAAWR